VSDDRVPTLNLAQFTFHSLYYCQTPVTTWGTQRLVTAVNGWYFPLIRAGWAVPLTFVLDAAMLLQRDGLKSSTSFQGMSIPREDRLLLNRYRNTLKLLARQPAFRQGAQLVRSIGDERLRYCAIRAFLRILVSGASGFENIYSFDTRDLKLLRVVLSARNDRIQYLVGVGDRPTARGALALRQFPQSRATPESVAVCDVLALLCDHYKQRRLDEVLTRESRMVMEIAARSQAGAGRVDYRLLGWLFGREDAEAVEPLPPRPRMVDEFLPTTEYQTEGNTGGYIDVNRKRFSGSVADVLPAELGLWPARVMFLHKLLNEGVLTYVRENFEFIERELRVLFCFVIDNHPHMREVSARAHHDLQAGVTPFIRARALAALMMHDLARYMPRQDVKLDLGVYVTSEESSAKFRAELDLFNKWTPAEARDRFHFLRGLAAEMHHLFYSRIMPEDARVNRALETDFREFMANRHRQKHYHCRHLVYLTSSATAASLVSGDEPRLDAHDTGPDSIHVVGCDLENVTLGIAAPSSSPDAAAVARGSRFGQTSEKRLREQFLETIFLKGAGRTALRGVDEPLGELA